MKLTSSVFTEMLPSYPDILDLASDYAVSSFAIFLIGTAGVRFEPRLDGFLIIRFVL